jgi:hypothetical protein
VKLYHASNYKTEGTHLCPKPNSTVLGQPGEYIFASPNEVGARAYAFKVNGCTIATLSLFNGRTSALINMGGESKYLAKVSRVGQLLEVPPQYFSPVRKEDGHATGEYIATKPIPLSECARQDLDLRTEMTSGLRIFFVKPGMEFAEFIGRLTQLKKEKGYTDDQVVRELLPAGVLSELEAGKVR